MPRESLTVSRLSKPTASDADSSDLPCLSHGQQTQAVKGREVPPRVATCSDTVQCQSRTLSHIMFAAREISRRGYGHPISASEMSSNLKYDIKF